MEVENGLTVNAGSVSQAAAFAEAFRQMFRYEGLAEILPELEHFRQNGGTLVLTDIPFDIADDFRREYRKIFRKTVREIPDAPFLALASCQGDLESMHRFSYENGIIKRSYLWSDQPMTTWICPECGAELPEPVSLSDLLECGAKAVCPGCGSPIFPEDSYRFTEEEIRLDESFSDGDLARALSLCRNHRPELEKDKLCGCFFCRKVFSPAEIGDWDMDESSRGTARCPHCDAPAFGYDSVIGESAGYPITANFLRQLNDYWKWEEMQK